VELHIEQGGILEKEHLNIGVVEGIVGLTHWIVTFEGFANHAGTTPMNRRQDALLASSKFIIAVNEVVNSVEGNQVGTVGKIAVQPGAYNVIPGKVVMGLELRDLSSDKIDMLFAQIEKRTAIIANESKVKVNFELQANASKPALTNKVLQQVILNASNELGLTTKLMQSGAGHDSQEVALIAPSAMIFIPSVGGISHSPKEFSTTLDIANGANVLLKTILAIDKGVAGLEINY
jgi:N-carbamoyl-L-amino-acid hydrolase